MKLLLILVTVFQVAFGGPQNMMLSPIFPPEAIMKMAMAKASTGESCQSTTLNHCQASFNKMLSISSDADWMHYEVLEEDINMYLNKSVDDGLLKLCQARSMFYQCLGAMYDDCMSPFNFAKNGLDFYSAWAFSRIFAELDFICNGGLLQSIQQWDCIRETKTIANKGMQQCWDLFMNYTADSPNEVCNFAEDMMLCFRVPYYFKCKESVAWWSCEQGRIAAGIDQYCPHLTCSYDTFPVVPDTDTGAQMAYNRPDPLYRTRREMFRSPNPGFMRPEKMQLYFQLAKKAEERAKRKKRSVEDEE